MRRTLVAVGALVVGACTVPVASRGPIAAPVAPTATPSSEVRGAPAVPEEATPSGPDECFARRSSTHLQIPRRDSTDSRSLSDRLIAHDVGVAVAVGRRLVFSHDATDPRIPASNQKLLLSMALLEEFGPGFRTRTSISGPGADGVVHGDLFVEGRGDPTLGDVSFRSSLGLAGSSSDRLAGSVFRTGIRRITGSVIGVRSFMRGDWDAFGWRTPVARAYSSRPTALSYNGNLSVAQPPELQAAEALTGSLERIGVRVDGAPAMARRIGTHVVAGTSSPPLIRILEVVNRDSWNFGAEVLSKALGARCFGVPGTIEKGARGIESWVRSLGLKVAAHDASGLSYANRVSPGEMVALLTAARARPWGRLFMRALPEAGEGTLEGRLAGLRVHVKTGSLFDGSHALSGWVWMEGRERWAAFSIMSSLGGAAPAIEDLVVRMISRW